MESSEHTVVLDQEREQVFEWSIQFIEKILKLPSDPETMLEAASLPPGTMARATF